MWAGLLFFSGSQYSKEKGSLFLQNNDRGIISLWGHLTSLHRPFLFSMLTCQRSEIPAQIA